MSTLSRKTGLKRSSGKAKRENVKKVKYGFNAPTDSLTAHSNSKIKAVKRAKAIPVSSLVPPANNTIILGKKDTNQLHSSQNQHLENTDLLLNIQTPRKSTNKPVRTPQSRDSQHTIHSSDDNIFWAVTPPLHKSRVKEQENEQFNPTLAGTSKDRDGSGNENTMPSSPLRNEIVVSRNYQELCLTQIR
ncbi:unnamed protein product [Ambrosiozyma monospora]|uniref:Unnamed protein product n=1 Tax=Ambrosiozyma monospora TaxID=43982 RepID=A0ACB5TEP7_AMBMO|nr:unnamed protein product [Ambrosiozyma monospora]